MAICLFVGGGAKIGERSEQEPQLLSPTPDLYISIKNIFRNGSCFFLNLLEVNHLLDLCIPLEPEPEPFKKL